MHVYILVYTKSGASRCSVSRKLVPRNFGSFMVVWFCGMLGSSVRRYLHTHNNGGVGVPISMAEYNTGDIPIRFLGQQLKQFTSLARKERSFSASVSAMGKSGSWLDGQGPEFGALRWRPATSIVPTNVIK